MVTPNSLPVPNTPFLDQRTGLVTREWTRFLYSLNRNTSDAVAGEVATPPGSGLEGGGFVADGVDLSIAGNGVTYAMIQQVTACSVVGRFQNSTGNVSAIIAVQDRTALQRQGDALAFFPYVDVPSVTCDDLTINATPAASVATVTHSIPIETDSGTMYILLSSVP